MSPKSGAVRNRSQTFSSPPDDDDIEAASQQLLAESSQPSASAVIGASYINAARALPRPPDIAPTTQPGKLGKPGKLKRVSLPDERRKRVRGAGIYELDPSPQKKRPSLPAQIEAVEEEHEVAPAVDAMEDVVPETSQVQPEDGQPIEAAASSDGLAGDEAAVEDPSVLSRQENAPAAAKKPRGRPPKRKSVESADSARLSDAGPAAMQEDIDSSITGNATAQQNRPEPEHTPAVKLKQTTRVPAAKKIKTLKGWKFRDPEAADSEDNPFPVKLRNARQRGDPQPQVQIPVRSTRSRTIQADIANAQDNSATVLLADALDHQSEVIPQPSRTTRSSRSVVEPTKKQATRSKATPEDDKADAEEDAGADAEAASRDAEEQEEELGEANNEQSQTEETGNVVEDGKENEDQAEQVGDDNDAQTTQQTSSHRPAQIPALEQVFRFAGSEERSGVCSTKLGRNIHRRCKRSHATLSQSGELPSMEDIVKCKDDLTTLLASIDSRVGEQRRLGFKRDAFSYLFRSLTLVLEAMHNKLHEKEGIIIESITAMRILYSLISGMLEFKGAIDAWKVKVPQRTQGDRLIKDVESGLIVPLRAVEKDFCIRLGTLRRVEQAHQARLATQRMREQEYQENQRREEVLSVARERRRRWQDLHIVRMQCEPDAARRRRLRFVEAVESVETDANGDEFERVPFLGERSMPPPRLAATSSDKEWTEEQETVLLDALQSSAGLEKIFKQHCRPGGALREFTVSDFAVKIAWVRSGWAQLSQQHGWEIPDWVQRVPVLP